MFDNILKAGLLNAVVHFNLRCKFSEAACYQSITLCTGRSIFCVCYDSIGCCGYSITRISMIRVSDNRRKGKGYWNWELSILGNPLEGWCKNGSFNGTLIIAVLYVSENGCRGGFGGAEWGFRGFLSLLSIKDISTIKTQMRRVRSERETLA